MDSWGGVGGGGSAVAGIKDSYKHKTLINHMMLKICMAKIWSVKKVLYSDTLILLKKIISYMYFPSVHVFIKFVYSSCSLLE